MKHLLLKDFKFLCALGLGVRLKVLFVLAVFALVTVVKIQAYIVFMKEIIRLRNIIYILELQNGKYYVERTIKIVTLSFRRS